jgi:hypothetical protein
MLGNPVDTSAIKQLCADALAHGWPLLRANLLMLAQSATAPMVP